MYKIRYFFFILAKLFIDYTYKSQCFSPSNSKIFARYSFAFSYKDFIDYSKLDNPILSNLSKVLNVKDLIDDAENTFIKNHNQNNIPCEEAAPFIDYNNQIEK